MRDGIYSFEITAAGTYSTNLSETENGASGNPITISAVTANSGSVYTSTESYNSAYVSDGVTHQVLFTVAAGDQCHRAVFVRPDRRGSKHCGRRLEESATRIGSLKDSKGNIYQLAVGPTVTVIIPVHLLREEHRGSQCCGERGDGYLQWISFLS